MGRYSGLVPNLIVIACCTAGMLLIIRAIHHNDWQQATFWEVGLIGYGLQLRDQS